MLRWVSKKILFVSINREMSAESSTWKPDEEKIVVPTDKNNIKNLEDPHPRNLESTDIEPKNDQVSNSEVETESEKSQPVGHLDQWQQGKDDENQFYSIYSNIENLKYKSRVTISKDVVKKKVLIHINSRNILPEVASDVRMMHRQVVRLLRLQEVGFRPPSSDWLYLGPYLIMQI